MKFINLTKQAAWRLLLSAALLPCSPTRPLSSLSREGQLKLFTNHMHMMSCHCDSCTAVKAAPPSGRTQQLIKQEKVGEREMEEWDGGF